MKLWVFSDLHRYHPRDDLSIPPNIDVIVAAGDIQDDNLLVNLAKRRPVVAVAGNHEFYEHEYASRLDQLRALPGVHFLENDAVTIDGVTFAGATLWTDYDGGDPVAMHLARRGMNDHRYITARKKPWARFLPEDAYRLHLESRAFLESTLPQADVIVTHHAPSYRSVHPKYQSNPLNPAFVSDLDDLVERSNAQFWIHGHVHSNFDYVVGKTRVICNPYGYRNENPDFIPDLVLECATSGSFPTPISATPTS